MCKDVEDKYPPSHLIHVIMRYVRRHALYHRNAYLEML